MRIFKRFTGSWRSASRLATRRLKTLPSALPARVFSPKVITIFSVFYFTVTGLTVLALFYSTRARTIAVTMAQAAIARASGYYVGISDFELGLFPPQLAITGVSVRKLGQPRPFFTSKKVRVMPGIARGIAGKIAVDWLEIDSPDVTLTWRDGQFEEFGHLLQARPDQAMQANIPVELWGTLLTRGHIRIVVPGKAVVDIKGLNILASPRATGTIPVDVVVPPIVIELPNRRVVLKDIRLGLNIKGGNLLAPKTVAVRNLEFVSDAGSMQTAGDVDMNGGGNLKVHSNLDLGILSVLFPSIPRLSGRVAFAAEIDADKAHPQVRLDIDAAGLAAADLKLGDIHAEIDASLEQILLKKIVVRSMGGEAQVSGWINPRLQFPAKIEVKWTGLELAQILEAAGLTDPWVTLKSNGSANVEGHLVPKNATDTLLTGTAHVDALHFISRDRSFRRGDYKAIIELKAIAIDLKLALHPNALDLTEATLKGEPGQVRCDVRFNFDQLLGFHIKGESDYLDIGALGLIAGIDIQGRGPLDFELGGPYGPPEISGKVQLDDASIEHIPLGHLDSAIKFEKGRYLVFPDAVAQLGSSIVEGNGSIDMDGPTLNITGSLDEGEVKDLLPLIPLPKLLATTLAGDVSGDFKLYGDASAPNLDVSFASNHVDAIDQPFEHVLGSVSLRQAQFRELTLDADVGGGSVEATLQGPPERLSVEATLSDLPVSELRFLQAARKNLSGKVSGRISAALGRSQVGEADLTVRELRVGNGRPAEMQAKIFLKGEEVKFDAAAFDGKLAVKGNASLGANPEFDLDVKLAQTPVGGLFGLPAEYEVITSGQGTMSGPFSNLDALEAELTLDTTTIEAPSLHAGTAKATSFSLERRRITFDKLKLVGKGLDVDIGGTVTLDGKLNVDIAGNLEAQVLLPFVPTIDMIEGQLPLDVRLLGTLGAPELRGSTKMKDFKMKMSFLDKPFEELDGDITLAGDSFVFDNLSASFGDGTVDASGNIRLGASGLQNLFFSAELEDVRYTAPGDLPLVMSGKVRVETNSAKNFDITGAVRIKELRYTHDLSLSGMMPGLKRRPTQTRTLEKSEERVNFDVALTADDNLIVDNNLAKAEFKADLRLTGTNLRTGLVGTVTPLRAQIFFTGKTFTVASGAIDFIDRFQILPRADLRLSTNACAADITIDVSGTADNYTLDMRGRDSNGAVRREDVQSCIALGFRQSEFSNAPGVSRFSTTEAVPLGLNLLSTATGLEEKLKKIIPIDQVSFGTGYTPRATGRTRSSPRIIVVKELGGGVKFRLTSSITETDDQKLELEFPLSQFSTVNTSWRNAGDITNDLGLDFKWRKEF